MKESTATRFSNGATFKLVGKTYRGHGLASSNHQYFKDAYLLLTLKNERN